MLSIYKIDIKSKYTSDTILACSCGDGMYYVEVVDKNNNLVEKDFFAGQITKNFINNFINTFGKEKVHINLELAEQ